jgi:Shikimate dehydrogenase substrate binding domain
LYCTRYETHEASAKVSILKSAGPLSNRRILTGLLGTPTARSPSPAIHARAAEALGLRRHYQFTEIAGAGKEKLTMLLEAFGIRASPSSMLPSPGTYQAAEHLNYLPA